MVLIDLKLIRREWKKILLVAFIIAVFLFFAGEFKSNDSTENITTFIFMFIGLFIGVSALWTAGNAILGFIISLKLLIKQKRDYKKDTENHRDSIQ